MMLRESSYNPRAQSIEQLIPKRFSDDRNVLAYLTRRQRLVYLLVDGRRTIADIARCTGKNVPEIARTLAELQQRGLLSVDYF